MSRSLTNRTDQQRALDGMRIKILGTTIRRIRQDANLTSEQIAQHTGMNRRTFEQIERGKTSPQWTSMCAIADALNVKPSELMSDVDLALKGWKTQQ